MTGTRKLEKEAQKWLMNSKYCRLALCNIYTWDWECDVFGVTKSDFTHEIEVKVSKMDFGADFRNKKGKHYSTKFGRGANYFWFCVPGELLEFVQERLPEYAGLLYLHKGGYIKVFHPAPILHSNKLDPEFWKQLSLKLFYKLNI